MSHLNPTPFFISHFLIIFSHPCLSLQTVMFVISFRLKSCMYSSLYHACYMCLSSHPFHFFALMISKNNDAFHHSAVCSLFVCVSVSIVCMCISEFRSQLMGKLYNVRARRTWRVGETVLRREDWSIGRRICLRASVFAANCSSIWMGSNSGLHCDRPVSKHLILGKTLRSAFSCTTFHTNAGMCSQSCSIKVCVHSPVQEKACVRSPVLGHVKLSWQPSQSPCDLIKVSSSSLVAVRVCLDSVLLSFSSVSPNKLWGATEITSRHLPSTYFPAHYPSVIQLLASYSLR